MVPLKSCESLLSSFFLSTPSLRRMVVWINFRWRLSSCHDVGAWTTYTSYKLCCLRFLVVPLFKLLCRTLNERYGQLFKAYFLDFTTVGVRFTTAKQYCGTRRLWGYRCCTATTKTQIGSVERRWHCRSWRQLSSLLLCRMLWPPTTIHRSPNTWTTCAKHGSIPPFGHLRRGLYFASQCEPTTTLRDGTAGWTSRSTTVGWTCTNWLSYCIRKATWLTSLSACSPSVAQCDYRRGRTAECTPDSTSYGMSTVFNLL